MFSSCRIHKPLCSKLRLHPGQGTFLSAVHFPLAWGLAKKCLQRSDIPPHCVRVALQLHFTLGTCPGTEASVHQKNTQLNVH